MNDEHGVSNTAADQSTSTPFKSNIPEETAPAGKQKLSSFLKTHKLKLAILFLAFSILVSILSYLVIRSITPPMTDRRYISDTPGQMYKPANIEDGFIPEVSKDQTGSQLALEEIEGVSYFTPKEIYKKVVLTDKESSLSTSFRFYEFGNIRSGKYEGGKLVLVERVLSGPCKGNSCGKPEFFRFVVKGDSAVWLTTLSKSAFSGEQFSNSNPFSEFGLRLSEDNAATIPALIYPKELSDANGNMVALVETNSELTGKLDLNKLVFAFEDPVYGKIYTTKAGLAPGDGYVVYETERGDSGMLVDGCEGDDCFNTNAFFWFRPDGTYLKYAYKPPFSENDIAWNHSFSDSKYIYYTIAGCTHDQFDYISVVPQASVSEDDLEVAGTVFEDKEPIYELKNKKHRIYTDFYDKYKKYETNSDDPYDENAVVVSYEQFINSIPLFLWRDPFGRLIRFNNEKFLPPYACEPIIYLYPEKAQEVTVRLGSRVNLIASDPLYKNGWSVIAEPSGKLTLGGNEYPYLFWEGWSHVLPLQKQGFVVKQQEVVGFLDKTLQRLGLNKKETDDFIKAWGGKLTGSAYYYISFVNQKDIDRLYPLEITPQPDTIIRVLMDYKPLDSFVSVPMPSLPEKPSRGGFTVVEWGGLRR